MSAAEEATYVSFFKCHDFADVGIVIKSTDKSSRKVRVVLLPQGSGDVQVQLRTADTILASFPGHRIILDKCPYFAAQVGPSFISITLQSDALCALRLGGAADLSQCTAAQVVTMQ